MNLLETKNGIRLGRDVGDKPFRRESEVAYHLRNLLNERDGDMPRGGRWVRINPSKCGLTACRIGVANWKLGIVYWHADYAIENAAKAFNAGSVTLIKANAGS